MTTSLKTSIAIGLVLAFNTGAFSGHAASAPNPTQRPAHHHKSDFDKAQAIAPRSLLPPAPAAHVPETDGLSRDREDCAMGCVDNN